MRLTEFLVDLFDPASHTAGPIALCCYPFTHLGLMLLGSTLIHLVLRGVFFPPSVTTMDVIAFAVCGPFSIHLLGQSFEPPAGVCAAVVLIPTLLGLVGALAINDLVHRRLTIGIIDSCSAIVWAFLGLMVVGLAIT